MFCYFESLLTIYVFFQDWIKPMCASFSSQFWWYHVIITLGAGTSNQTNCVAIDLLVFCQCHASIVGGTWFLLRWATVYFMATAILVKRYFMPLDCAKHRWKWLRFRIIGVTPVPAKEELHTQKGIQMPGHSFNILKEIPYKLWNMWWLTASTSIWGLQKWLPLPNDVPVAG